MTIVKIGVLSHRGMTDLYKCEKCLKEITVVLEENRKLAYCPFCGKK